MQEKQPERVVRKMEVLSRISLSDATVWRMEKAGKFPRRIQLGGNSVGWLESEVNEWLTAKANDRMELRSAVVPVCPANTGGV